MNAKQKAKRETLLREVIASLEKSDDGRYDFKGSFFGLDKNYLLLIPAIMEDEKTRNWLDSAKYCFYPFNALNAFPMIKNILIELKIEREYKFNRFIVRIKEEIEKLDPKTFELYYPINLEISKRRRKIELNDINLEIKTYDEIKNIFHGKRIKDDFRYAGIKLILNNETPKEELKKDPNKLFNPSKYGYIKIRVDARNENFAVKYSKKYVNFIISIIAYSKNFGVPSTNPNKYEPMSSLKLNYFFVFDGDNFSQFDRFSNNSDNNRIYKFESRDQKTLDNILRIFKKRNEKMQEKIFKIFELYHEGLIHDELKYSFLSFWICLEVVSLKGKNVSQTEVIKRLKSLFKAIPTLDDIYLKRICELRHELIHEGEYSGLTDSYRNVLKSYVEEFINTFLSHLSDRDIDEIQSIFYYLRKDIKELENHRKSINFIIRSKRRKQNEIH